MQDKKEVITQWDMGDVKRTGLLKMDFLGLRNLTILSKVIDLIEQTTGRRIDPYQFPPRRPRDVRPACAAARRRACSSWKAAASATCCSG